MFIELTDVLRCPRGHDEAYVVAVPVMMDGRDIVRGGIGCPVCGAEFPIVERVAYFGERADARTHRRTDAPAHRRAEQPPYDARALTAFLDLQGEGGYAVLVGSAARLGAQVTEIIGLAHWVAVNPPPGVVLPAAVSRLESPAGLPFKTSSVRAVVVGADCAQEPWLSEAVRILLNRQRLVIESDRASPAGVAELARGAGLLVAEKRRA